MIFIWPPPSRDQSSHGPSPRRRTHPSLRSGNQTPGHAARVQRNCQKVGHGIRGARPGIPGLLSITPHATSTPPRKLAAALSITARRSVGPVVDHVLNAFDADSTASRAWVVHAGCPSVTREPVKGFLRSNVLPSRPFRAWLSKMSCVAKELLKSSCLTLPIVTGDRRAGFEVSTCLCPAYLR